MRLEYVHLHQVCQHENVTHTFSSGLVGILGQNGAGKSNFVNMAMASLTGDFSVNPGVKDDNIRSGIPDDDYSAVTTRWSHNGKLIEVRRSLKNSFNYLKIDNVDTGLRNTKEITSKIEELIGIPKQLLSFMFVPQWEIFSIISADPATRASTFAHLCGISQFEKVYAALSARIKDDRGMVSTVLDTREEITKRMSTRFRQIDTYEAEYVQHQANVLPANVLTLTKQQADKKDKYDNLSEQVTKQNKTLRVLRARLQDAETAKQAAQDNLEVKSAAAAALEDKASKAARLLEDISKSKAVAKQIEELKQQAKPSLTKAPPMPERFTERDVVEDELSEMTAERCRLKTIVDMFNKPELSGQKCPTCGCSITNLLQNKQHIMSEYSLLVAKISNHQELLQSFNNYETTFTAVKRQNDAAVFSAQIAKNQLERLVDANPVCGDEHELNAVIAQHAEAESYATGASNRLNTATQKWCETNGAVTEAGNTRKRLLREIEKLQYDEAESAIATSKLEAHNIAASEMRILKERIADLLSANAVDQDESDRITALIERSAAAKEWLAELEEVKEFAHKDNFPKLAAQDWLLSMLERINSILIDFDSPFRVEAGEDLTFIAVKPDGRRERAERLSGGEKVLLALAFRFAVNSLMAVDIGMMILDEPTAGVDKSNLNNLTEILANVSKYTKDKGMQLIIITHDEALQRAFDQTITISKA